MKVMGHEHLVKVMGHEHLVYVGYGTWASSVGNET